MELLQCTATLPVGCHTARGQRVVQLLHCTATLPRDTRGWNCCNARPHHLSAVGNESATMHCHIAWCK